MRYDGKGMAAVQIVTGSVEMPSVRVPKFTPASNRIHPAPRPVPNLNHFMSKQVHRSRDPAQHIVATSTAFPHANFIRGGLIEAARRPVTSLDRP
jgi:hypothetical protein